MAFTSNANCSSSFLQLFAALTKSARSHLFCICRRRGEMCKVRARIRSSDQLSCLQFCWRYIVQFARKWIEAYGHRQWIDAVLHSWVPNQTMCMHWVLACLYIYKRTRRVHTHTYTHRIPFMGAFHGRTCTQCKVDQIHEHISHTIKRAHLSRIESLKEQSFWLWHIRFCTHALTEMAQ